MEAVWTIDTGSEHKTDEAGLAATPGEGPVTVAKSMGNRSTDVQTSSVRVRVRPPETTHHERLPDCPVLVVLAATVSWVWHASYFVPCVAHGDCRLPVMATESEGT
jgi:hypothetical protein